MILKKINKSPSSSSLLLTRGRLAMRGQSKQISCTIVRLTWDMRSRKRIQNSVSTEGPLSLFLSRDFLDIGRNGNAQLMWCASGDKKQNTLKRGLYSHHIRWILYNKKKSSSSSCVFLSNSFCLIFIRKAPRASSWPITNHNPTRPSSNFCKLNLPPPRTPAHAPPRPPPLSDCPHPAFLRSNQYLSARAHRQLGSKNALGT